MSKVFYLFTRQKAPGLQYDHVWYQNYLQGTNTDKYYGTFLQWPELVWEHANNFSVTWQQIYHFRHFLNFFYFFIALVCFYLLLKDRFQARWLAVAGVLAVIVSPRFFAEAFYNNKDILFASMYIVAIYVFTRWLKKPSWVLTIAAGLVGALAMNTRIIALAVPVMFIGAILLKRLFAKEWSILLKVAALLVVLFLTYILTQPTAWGGELAFIQQVVSVFSDFTTWDGKTLYFGRLVGRGEIPWHYVPGYLWATTPLGITALVAVGIGAFLWSFFNQVWALKRRTFKKVLAILTQQDVLVFVSVLGPWLAAVVSGSLLYDSWRHFYFIYFPLIYFLVFGLQYFPQKWLRWLLCGILGLTLVLSGVWIMKNHPHQFIYYNPVVRPSAGVLFERDYWWMSRPELYSLLLDQDRNRTTPYRLHVIDPITSWVRITLSADELERQYQFVYEKDEADYAGVIFREYPGADVMEYLAGEGYENFIVVNTIKYNGLPVALLLRRR